MTQAICDITTDEVNVDVVVEPQADTMVEVANRAGGIEQVFHDNTLIGNGNSVDLGVNTDIIATKEYVDEKVETIDTYTKDQIDGKLTAVDAQIDANADAIQKTREDYIEADSEIHQILNSHATELTTLRWNQASLGDQVSGIEEKIPESASATNQLTTKEYVDNAILALPRFRTQVVDSLPSVGEERVLYLVKKTGTDVDSYDEYIWVPDVAKFEYVGTTQVDLSAYATTDYVDTVEQEIRADMNEKDSQLESIINEHAESITTIKTDLGDLGEQVANIESKIPDSTSDTNPLINKQQLLDEEMDIREDLNEGLSELQTQITAQAAEIATKQDQLTAGDNIIISNNVISATGAGGGAGFDIVVVQELPATGQKGIIYLLAKDGTAPDVYDEYVWIDATQTFELIGTTQVDLTDYAKKEELDNYLPLTGGEMTGAITFSDTEYSVSYNTSFNGLTIFTSPSRGFVFTNSGYSSIYPTSTGAAELGRSSNYWRRIYVTKLNNGADIAIPATGGTLARLEDITDINNNSIITKDLTVSTDEGTLNIGITAGVATIATNNGLDIVAQTKFDTAPTTDDNTTYANALDTSLVRKAQVATAIADAMANVDALPDQTGNAEKVLTTDGTNASWTEMPGLIIRRL